MTDLSVLSALEAVRFLGWLDPDGRHNLVALDPTGREAPEALLVDFDCSGGDRPPQSEAVSFIKRWNGKRNLYFSVNEPKEGAREGTKLRRDEIGAVRAFHVDIDQLEGAPDWDMDCLPSAVVDSGGGKWGFWKLAEKIPAEDVAAIEAQNRALTARFHGDTQAHNLDRIARLPGTLNIPNEAKRKKGRTEAVAKVVTLGGPVWEPGEVAAWCPPAPVNNKDLVNSREVNNTPLAELDSPASVAKATRWLLTEAPEAIEGEGGDETTYRIAARLKDFGVSQQTAFELLLDGWNETKASPSWPASELLQKVKNAYRHGTAAPGKLAPNLAETEFEPVEIEQSAKPKKRQMQALPFDEITQDLKAESRHLIDGWYDQGTTIVTYGESNSGKTHVVLDQSLAIAAGRTWAGRKTHKGLVIYVAAEGGPGIVRRVMAHRIFRPENKNLPFALISFPIDLMHNAADGKALLALVREQEQRFGQKCVMIVVDTLSRALAGGDENSSSDMGAFVKRCDEIRAACGAALHIIHHAGKNTAKGARGHSLLRAAVDTEIEIENGAILCRKQRDMEAAPDLRFGYKGVEIGVRADGSKVSSVVLDVWEQTEFHTELTPQALEAYKVAESVITQKTQKIGGENAAEFPSLVSPKELVRDGIPRGSVDRALMELVENGVMVKSRRGLYKIVRSIIPS